MFPKYRFKKIREYLKSRTDKEIYPDEIFLDSSNLPDFDTSQFEGRLEKPISKYTIYIVAFVFLCVGLVFVGRLWYLQVTKADEYRTLSENNRLDHSVIFAERGVVFDRNGVELVWNIAGASDEFSERAYDNRSGVSHVLGYIQYPLKDSSGNFYKKESVGRAGVEKTLGELLDGENGLTIVETDARGEQKSKSVIQPSRNGKNVTLSVDVEVQNALYGFIENLAHDVGFVGGAGVLMDVENGELLSLVSFPEYSSQAVVDAEKSALQRYQKDSRKPFLNRAVAGLYTPGSIIKPFIALGALEEKVITPEKKIISTGSIVVPHPYFEGVNSVFTDWKAHGAVDMRDALAVSSNVYFYEIGGGFTSETGREQKGLGIANIEKYVRLFGFGEQTGIQLRPEAEGTIPSPTWKKETFEDGVWRLGDTYHTAIGQYGFQVTPVQAVRAVAAIANYGKLLVPTLVNDDTVSFDKIAIQKEYFNIVHEGMRQAVTDGTGKGLYIPQVKVAAKTGTAELGSKKQFVNSWVVGFFPYEKPRFAFVVIMERGPQNNTIGGLYVMRQLLEWMSVHTPEYLESSR